MNVAHYTWLPVVGALVGCAIFAGSRTAKHDRSIAPDPSTFAPPTVVVAPEVVTHSEHAAVTVPRVTSDPVLRPRAKRVAPPKLDTVEPWTGEDLAPQLELAARARPRLEIDRRDAWDPSIIYEAAPGQDDRRLDDGDPWMSTASLDRRREPVREKVTHRLADEDPWGAAQIEPAAEGAKSATNRFSRL